jgi:tetratricopeptide (TPR) repeat protein
MITLSTLQKLRGKESLQKYIISCHGGDIASFLRELGLGLSALVKKDLKTAEKYINRARNVFQYLPREYEPRRFVLEGRYSLWSGNYELARKYYSKAMQLYELRGDVDAIARLGMGLVDTYMYLGRYSEALETGKRSLRYFRRTKQRSHAAIVLINMGNVYHRMDNNRMALRYYDKAKAMAGKASDEMLAMLHLNQANIYANLNQLRISQRLYQMAAKLFGRAGMRISEAQAHYSLAYLLFLEDNYTESIRLLEQVYDRFVALGDRRMAALTLLDMAEIDIQLNQYGSAIMIADNVIPEFKKLGLRYEEAKANYFASDARTKLSNFESAARQLNRAEKLFAAERNSLWLGMVNIARSKLLLAQGQYARAIKASTDARNHFRKSADERRKTDADITLMEAVVASGDIERALKMSRTLVKKKLISYQSYNLSCLIGRCYYKTGDYATALPYFKDAVAVIERMLEGLYPDEIRFFFVTDKYDSYKLVIDCLLKLGRLEDSFLTSLRALEILNRKFPVRGKPRRRIPPDLIQKRTELRAALKKLIQSPKGNERRAEQLPSYNYIEQSLWANERKIRSFLYPSRMPSPPFDSDGYDIESLVENDETIINFFLFDTVSGAFCVNKREVKFVRLDILPGELDIILRKLHFIFEKAVYNLKEAEETVSISEYYLRLLYSIIFKPLTPNILTNRIIIIADGSFGQIPFIALKNEQGQYLKDVYQIKVGVDPRDLIRKKRSTGVIEKGRNAIFAVSSHKLPSIDMEARRIKEIFTESTIYLNESAKSRNLVRELREADGFIHIAAHASRSSENPLFSRILLGDGPFFPFDLFGLQMQTRLLTLSGCQTAAPGLYYGNSFSLAKAFYQAGSQHVLATLWPISDKLSVVFMTEFYRSLADGKNVTNAYQGAVDTVARVTGNPAFWSSFVLLGI